jgi:hypothetical protein
MRDLHGRQRNFEPARDERFERCIGASTIWESAHARLEYPVTRMILKPHDLVGSSLRATTESQRLDCGNSGPRWSTEIYDHRSWCLAPNGDQGPPNVETAARDSALATCRAVRRGFRALNSSPCNFVARRPTKAPNRRCLPPCYPAWNSLTASARGDVEDGDTERARIVNPGPLAKNI